jgi:hypothetical protein
MQKYNLKHSSNVTTILKRKDSIVRAMSRDVSQSAKAIRSSKFPMIDKHLRDFVSESNMNGKRVTHLMLHSMAIRLAQEYGVSHKFNPNKAYMDKFLVNQKVCKPPVTLEAGISMTTISHPIPASSTAISCQPLVAPVKVKTDLQSKLLHDLQLFTREHVHKVSLQVGRIMQAVIHMTEEEVKQTTRFKEELLDNLHEFSSSAIVSLIESQNVDSIHSFIDLGENLMFKLISLSENLLMRFSRLSLEIQMQAIADRTVSKWQRMDSMASGEEEEGPDSQVKGDASKK